MHYPSLLKPNSSVCQVIVLDCCVVSYRVSARIIYLFVRFYTRVHYIVYVKALRRREQGLTNLLSEKIILNIAKLPAETIVTIIKGSNHRSAQNFQFVYLFPEVSERYPLVSYSRSFRTQSIRTQVQTIRTQFESLRTRTTG